jgi:hypothetical protein
MIETFEGRLGGGKTYTALQRICNVLAAGGYVATNIKIMVEPWKHKKWGDQRGLRAILKARGWDLKDDQLIYLPDYEYVDFESRQDKKVYRLSKLQAFWTLIPQVDDGVILVVIDEAHFHFPQSGFRSIPNDVVEFLTLSRHRQTDIIFISQHIKNMWCQMSRLAQYRWEFRDMKKHGIYVKMGGFIPAFTLPWPFPHILQSQYDYDGKTVISKKWDWHDFTVHECYDSPDLVNAFASAGSKKTYHNNKRGLTVWQKLVLLGGGAFFASLAWGCAYIKKPSVSSSAVVSAVAPSNMPAVVRSAPVVHSVPSVPEYFQSAIIGGGSDRLSTSKRTYKLGDVLEGGVIIAEILQDGFVSISPAGRSETHFQPAPRLVPAPVRQSVVPESIGLFGKAQP